ncbi:MAG: FAD-binding protein [Pseudobdellovibrionaceae bacterium]|nr:FAD-binding protein [Bdellovibrionales bacterium]USN48280.1 MAG: FAD-binding protein [Pseudobdellovibrionaceae bacterium]
MSQIFHNIKIGLDEELEDHLQWMAPNYSSYHILRKSVDARRRHSPQIVFSVEVFSENEAPPKVDFDIDRVAYSGAPVLIIGSGPAGLFAALRLLERGIPCIVFEQGSSTEQRMKHINRYWRYGELNSRNNVCFGEGGAGLYSDGKLITRIKSPHIPYVLRRLVDFGAPEEILYLANPHVGSDRLRRIIPHIRKHILSSGGQIYFNTKVQSLLLEPDRVIGVQTEDGAKHFSDHIILACGHSATDLFEHLQQQGVHIEGKSFALGLRIEHPQKLIDQIQYREFAGHPKLGVANYKITHHDDKNDVGVYSFCMCPGGYVLSSGTEADGLVSNGMSNYNRNSPYANAAVVVTVDHEKSFGNDLWGGMKMRRQLEREAFHQVQKAGGIRQLPVQKITDFIDGKLGKALKGSCPSGVLPLRLDELLPPTITNYLREGLERFSKTMPEFITDQGQFYGVETRTSCPLRITRDKTTLQSLSHQGLYPTGEGAGYAGGITSAACDGVRVADAIF